jgi:hypothetical protein
MDTTSPSDGTLDKLLNTGLSIGKLFFPGSQPTSNAKTVTTQPTNWGEIALIGGGVIGAIVLLVVLLKK